jgi:rhodanese-related sulfurtransferase
VRHEGGGSIARRQLGGVLLGAVGIALGSATLGIAVNHWSPRGIPVLPRPGEERLPLPPGVQALSLAEAGAAFESGSALFVDARCPEEYEEEHIPGAVNVPRDEYEEWVLDVADQIESAPAVVVYCSGDDCGDAIEVAERLLEIREGPIDVIEVGWEAWEEAGYATAEGPEA